MKTRAILAVAALLSAAASVASAHPGHGDHDFTWDFDHLVEHPVATIAWLGIFAGATWVVARLVRTSRVVRTRK
jgi:hydrogenase/urease accessory protein HupE